MQIRYSCTRSSLENQDAFVFELLHRARDFQLSNVTHRCGTYSAAFSDHHKTPHPPHSNILEATGSAFYNTPKRCLELHTFHAPKDELRRQFCEWYLRILDTTKVRQEQVLENCELGVENPIGRLYGIK